MAQAFGRFLDQDPLRYKMFGVYWWAVKENLRDYFYDFHRWYCGTFSDPLMQSRADHGSRLRNLVAVPIMRTIAMSTLTGTPGLTRMAESMNTTSLTMIWGRKK
jgi:hypothetical protein